MYTWSFLTVNDPQKSKCAGQYRGTPLSCVVIARLRRLLPFRSPPTPVLGQHSALPLGKLVHWNYHTGYCGNRFLPGSCKETEASKKALPSSDHRETGDGRRPLGGCGGAVLRTGNGRVFCTPPPKPPPPSSQPTSKSGLVTCAPPLHAFYARTHARIHTRTITRLIYLLSMRDGMSRIHSHYCINFKAFLYLKSNVYPVFTEIPLKR